MTRQEELDLLETEMLNDLFGGVSADKMVIGVGLFKIDLSGKVQRMIDELESVLLPVMDERGLVLAKDIRSVLNIDPSILSAIPDKKFRPVEAYRLLSPMVKRIKGMLI